MAGGAAEPESLLAVGHSESLPFGIFLAAGPAHLSQPPGLLDSIPFLAAGAASGGSSHLLLVAMGKRGFYWQSGGCMIGRHRSLCFSWRGAVRMAAAVMSFQY